MLNFPWQLQEREGSICLCVSKRFCIGLEAYLPVFPLQCLRSGEQSGTFPKQNCNENIWFSHNNIVQRKCDSFPALLTSLSCIFHGFSLFFKLLPLCWYLSEQLPQVAHHILSMFLTALCAAGTVHVLGLEAEGHPDLTSCVSEES